MEKNTIPSLDKVHGHSRHCYLEYFCDHCGKDCTSKFYEIFVNDYIKLLGTTASNPFRQVRMVKKHLCPECAEQVGVNFLIK